MNGQYLWELPLTEELGENDGILMTQESGGSWNLLDKIKAFLGTSTDPAELGVPIPTIADTGKIPTVKAEGAGFELLLQETMELLWKNENPSGSSFPAQTIAHDNSAYKLFVITYYNNEGKFEIIPKNSGTVYLRQLRITSSTEPPRAYVSTRTVTVDDTGFTFGRYTNQAFPNPYPGQWSGGDSAYRPLAIYGIR